MRILGFDPGRHNFAWAIYGEKGLEDHGVLEGAGDITRLRYFSKEVDRLLARFSPDAVGIERYHLRKGTGFVGNMELVNLEIGIVQQISWEYFTPSALVLPSVHKTWHGKNSGATKKSKKLSMHTCPEFLHMGTEHEADAAAVAKYCKYKVFHG